MRIHLATKRMQSGQMGCHAHNGVGRVCICIFAVIPSVYRDLTRGHSLCIPIPFFKSLAAKVTRPARSCTMERRRGRAPWRGVGNSVFNQAGGSVNGGLDQTNDGSVNQGGGGGSGTGCDMDGEWRVSPILLLARKNP